MLWTIVWLGVVAEHVNADCYLNNPRGSNNKLSEQSNNVQNANRLFDSQNNAASGYQIGDDCKPVCQTGNNNPNYDETAPGAMQGTMKYYKGSELYVEWLNQHGCGAEHTNLRCQIILQYMCEADNPALRDGTKRGNDNTAGGEQEPPTVEDAADPTLGQHEPLAFYLACKARERNKGLYIADQNVNNNRGATATRQNAGGNNANNRHGLECPEERDYFPYWHPTPWHDIAILTEEPQERCEYYRNESQNVKPKGSCSIPAENNPASCVDSGGQWIEQDAFNEPPPECIGGIKSRDNHNGNVRNGHAMYYLWNIPPEAQGRCVLRVRYNITTKDFDVGAKIFADADGATGTDHFFIDASFNGEGRRRRGGRRRTPFAGRAAGSDEPIIAQDPRGDWLELGEDKELQIQVNTNQYGRTFEDRTHTFIVQERPPDVSDSVRIVNYNTRGRRGNIVQTYPSVEYDFVPEDLVVEEGTLLHFQWAGSDANANGNAGNGRQGTDRSNFVQVASKAETVPLPLSKHSFFFDAATDPNNAVGQELVQRFAFLDQDTNVACDPETDDDNAVGNCRQLNGASAYFDGGLVEMTQVGEHLFSSTRNNDFTNRAQKSTITVTQATLSPTNVGVGATAFVAAGLALYLVAALYALKHPTSWLFSKKYRPRVLHLLVSSDTLAARVQERRRRETERQEKWAAETMSVHMETGKSGHGDVAMAWKKNSLFERMLICCHRRGIGEHRLTLLSYGALNILIFAIGFLSNYGGGFRKSLAYPFAKGGGYAMDLNFSIVLLPTLKSLQTALRRAGSSREWMPIDDPIAFHIAVACCIVFWALVHIAGHCVHMMTIRSAPPLQHDPLHLWALSPEEEASGSTFLSQFLNLDNRCAAITGVVIAVIMTGMYVTAMPCARRGTNSLTRRLGGYNLFMRAHLLWKWVFVLLMLHAPARLWIWFFFPALLVMMDRMLLSRQQCLHAVLTQVRLLPRDVIGLTFQTPPGFKYQAGQYIHLGWQGEWHPFTLTSAPEERCISVHIRAPDALDWCSALRKRLVNEAPAEAAAASGRQHQKPQPGTIVQYRRCQDVANAMVYSRPGIGSGGNEGDGSTQATLPKDAVVLSIAGPFGAPAQKVWDFNTLMVVGAGIGVTPFASILRSVQLRVTQRETVLKAAAPTTRWTQMASTTAGKVANDLNELLEDVVVVPKRIYFYWIVRSQEEFDWFFDLLAAATDGPMQNIVDISVFMTGEIELSRVKKLPCSNGQFFGRPNWGRIFKQNREQHKGEHVGVFLCGSPLIGKELDRQSRRNSDPIDRPGGTRFSFYTEHF